MKKFFFFLSAIALLGLTAACVEQQEVNPNFDAATNTVKTSFVINIATDAQTKVSEAAVQEGQDTPNKPKFRGMDDMKLFVSNQHPAAGDFIPNYRFDLGTLSTTDIKTTQSSKLYDLSIPTGVNNMVFYAKSAGNTGAVNTINAAVWAADKPGLENGKTGYNIGTDKAGTHFDAWQILSKANTDGTMAAVDMGDFTARGECLAAILNDIIAAEGSYTDANQNEVKVKWSSFTESTDLAHKPLKDAYAQITTIGSGELRLGSGPAIVRMINDLYLVCGDIIEKSTTPADIDAVADAINTKIGQYFTTTGGEFRIKNFSSLQSSGVFAVDPMHTTITNGASTYEWNTGVFANFPRNMGLPSGAAQLTYDTRNGFSYVTASTVVATGTLPDKYIYPAELCYWVCSPLTVTDLDVPKADWPNTVAAWSAPNSWGGWTRNGTVHSSTRSVALQNNVQYGTALLKTYVKLGATTLKDNRKAIMEKSGETEADMEIDLTKDGNFNLMGVLVGGQPKQVSWNWAPAAGTDMSYVVYDRYLLTGAKEGLPTTTTNTFGPVYTTVYDNLVVGKETTEQSPVYVALELENNTGKDFWGRDNLIRKNGRFYLIGKLDIADADVSGITYPVNTDENGLRFPPLKAQHVAAGGSAKESNDYDNHEVIRVFMQDFATSVTFTIGENALKEAYATVPDLRAVEMNFGLSVDLEWSAGPVFSVALNGPAQNNGTTTGTNPGN